LLPIENSTNGSVVQALDLLGKCSSFDGGQYPDIQVCEEHYLPVHHYVYTNSSTSSDLSNIKILYTHPQVWTQCSKYLAKHFAHAERIDVSSTAAICSRLAGEAWKLQCVAEQIEDEPGKNTTRFFVLRNRTSERERLPLDTLPSRIRILQVSVLHRILPSAQRGRFL
ncbi:hypothetical protein DV735_g5925, partial [Chaetothyriales sp. CBS 134920]